MRKQRWADTMNPCSAMSVVRNALNFLSQPSLWIRPVLNSDPPQLQRFFAALGQHTLGQRFRCAFNGLCPKRIELLIDQALAPGQQVQMWVATERRGTAQQIVAQGGFIVNSGGVPEAEFALVVADSHQRRGFGARLLQAMRQGACAHVLCVLRATVRSDNRGMRSLLGLREQRRSASARQGSAQESPQQSPQISRHGECQALPAAQQARGTAFEAVLDTAPGWRFRHRLPMFAALCQARQDELPTQPAQRHLREVTPRMQVA